MQLFYPPPKTMVKSNTTWVDAISFGKVIFSQFPHSYSWLSILFTTFAGLPTAMLSEGMSFTTTLPAPMVTLSPIVTPGRIVTLPPIQQLSPILTGRAHSFLVLRSMGLVEWQAVYMLTFGPIKQSSPMVTIASSSTVQLKLAKKRLPTLMCLP